MAHRALWRGAISFGLIYVPVEMYAAARDGSLHLHLLDSRDFAPIGYERVNKKTGKAVEWSDIVKGYEYQKGNYVALSETLQSTKKVAVATFVMRGRQHLCVVAPHERALMLMTLRFASDLLAADDLELPAASPKAAKLNSAELQMAKKLVDEMSSPWRPDVFKDTYRADLMRRIKEKIRKKQTHDLATPPPEDAERPKAEVIDLMEALRNSLKGVGRRPVARAAPRAPSRSRKRA